MRAGRVGERHVVGLDLELRQQRELDGAIDLEIPPRLLFDQGNNSSFVRIRRDQERRDERRGDQENDQREKPDEQFLQGLPPIRSRRGTRAIVS
jgi:hypothetical protein